MDFETWMARQGMDDLPKDGGGKFVVTDGKLDDSELGDHRIVFGPTMDVLGVRGYVPCNLEYKAMVLNEDWMLAADVIRDAEKKVAETFNIPA